jgi:hypothetical protein
MIKALTLLLFIFIIVLLLWKKHKTVLQIIVFFLPFAIEPYKSSNLNLAISVYLIWIYWLFSKIFKSKEQELTHHPVKVWYLYIFLVLGLVMGIINIDRIKYLDNFTRMDPEYQILNISLYIFTAVLFIKILSGFASEREFNFRLIMIFVVSSFVHLISDLASISFIGNIIPQYLISKPVITYESTFGIIVPRYAALLGSYEFVSDYALITIALSLVLMLNKKYFGRATTAIFASIIVSIMSGTRSFFLILFIFILIIILFNWRKLGKVVRYGVVLGIIIFLTLPFYADVIKHLPLFSRVLDTIYKFQVSGFQGASNRNYGAGFKSLLDYGNIFGLGSYYFNTLGNSEIVSHNLLFALYAKYGLFGVGVILTIFSKLFLLLRTTIKTTADSKIKQEAIIYFSLLVALFAQELKYSFIRQSSAILVYVFLFMNIYYFIRIVLDQSKYPNN